MNWAAFAAITSGLGIVASLLTAAFVYGKLTQRQNDQSGRIDKVEGVQEKHAERFDVHSERIGEHDVKIGKIEEWKSGFSTGVKVTGNQSS